MPRSSTGPVVKHNYIRHNNWRSKASQNRDTSQGRKLHEARGKAMSSIRYYQMRSRGEDEPPRQIFTKEGTVSREEAYRMMEGSQGKDFLVHRIIISPGPNREDVNLREMTRDVMSQLEHEREQQINWVAIEHHNTDHAHVHLVVFGGAKDLDDERNLTGNYKVLRIGREDHDFLIDRTESYCDRDIGNREVFNREMDRAREREDLKALQDMRWRAAKEIDTDQTPERRYATQNNHRDRGPYISPNLLGLPARRGLTDEVIQKDRDKKKDKDKDREVDLFDF